MAWGATETSRTALQLQISTYPLPVSLKELEKTNKELESFNYIASHDLQEPLRKIHTFIRLLENNADNVELRKKYVEKIITSATRMSALIHSVLEYSRMSRPSSAFSETDLNEVLNVVKSDEEL